MGQEDRHRKDRECFARAVADTRLELLERIRGLDGYRRETASLQSQSNTLTSEYVLQPSPRRRCRATSSDQAWTSSISIDGDKQSDCLAGEEGSGGRR